MQASHFGFRIAEVPARTPLLRRRVLGQALAGDGLRTEDALAPPGACSAPDAICCGRGSSRLDRGPRGRADHRRAGDDARGRLQPHLAAARGRLSGMRTAAAAGAAARPRLRGRPQLRPAGAPRDGRRRSRSGGARGPGSRDPWSPTCGRCRLPTARFASVLSVQSIEHVPDPERASRRGRPGARAGRHGGLRHPEQAHLRPGRRDHRSLPLRRVLDPMQLEALCRD